MKLKSLVLGLSLVLLPLVASVSAEQPDKADSYEASIESWHKDRIAHLTAPDGYLSLTGLHWLSDKPQTFPGIGTATLEGQDVVLKLADGVTVDGKPVKTARVTLDMKRGQPDFHFGTSHFFVIRHGAKIALRVKDPNAQVRTSFTGISVFPIDPQWRLTGRFEADQKTIPVASVVDEDTDEMSPGWAVFDRAGKTYKVRLMGDVQDDSYFLVFSDATAGKSTYSGMRFLDVEKTPQGELVLDFNKAENPPCSMTPFATCPLPPKENVLPFAIEAGEKYTGSATH